MSLIQYNAGVPVLSLDAIEQFTYFEKQKKLLDAMEKDYKERLKAEMESQEIVKLETDNVTVTYIAASDRETLDTKALKAECPDVYDSYVKLSPVKSSIRVKVK